MFVHNGLNVFNSLYIDEEEAVTNDFAQGE